MLQHKPSINLPNTNFIIFFLYKAQKDKAKKSMYHLSSLAKFGHSAKTEKVAAESEGIGGSPRVTLTASGVEKFVHFLL